MQGIPLRESFDNNGQMRKAPLLIGGCTTLNRYWAGTLLWDWYGQLRYLPFTFCRYGGPLHIPVPGV